MADVTNKDRARAAHIAVVAFREQMSGDYEDAIGDLICDLLHLARREFPERNPLMIAVKAMHMFSDEEMEDG